MFLTIAADGMALPCHTARMLPGLDVPERARQDVRGSGRTPEGFNAYRGGGWMKEPCRSCPEKEKDLGGCRCQAFMLAQRSGCADPVCDKSPHHGVVVAAVEKAQQSRDSVDAKPLIFRGRRESKELARPF